jgi:hypothetical protein
MKKLASLLLLLACCQPLLTAQDGQGITERLGEYFEATKAKDWQKVVDMVYPKLFTLVDKSEMVQMFQDMEGNGMEFQMGEFEIRAISEIASHHGERFALVDYLAVMKIRFTSQADRDPEVQALLQANFEQHYGAENVRYKREDNSFEIRAEKAMFAISDEGSQAWAFIESDSVNEALIGAIIPDEIKEKFKNK